MSHPATFAEKVNTFNASLKFDGKLPAGITIMNPFKENACATPASIAFYDKFYNDSKCRYAILGINPGRFGAGITGVPFTDPVRLREACGIHIPACPQAREPSSVFVYEIISVYGGVEKFYKDWYINSICPLGFLKENGKGKLVNYNYYDSVSLREAAKPFIMRTLPEQLALGLATSVCFCFGKGKNFEFLQKINEEKNFFKKIIALDHPRFIVQYKSSQMREYAHRYAQAFHEAMESSPS